MRRPFGIIGVLEHDRVIKEVIHFINSRLTIEGNIDEEIF